MYVLAWFLLIFSNDRLFFFVLLKRGDFFTCDVLSNVTTLKNEALIQGLLTTVLSNQLLHGCRCFAMKGENKIKKEKNLGWKENSK